jgi:glycosyltransferase involved in cell wall biosynthesis
VRILHVASHFGVYRGGAVQLNRIACTQKRMGHDVYVIFNLNPRKSETVKERDYNSWDSLKKSGVIYQPLNYQNVKGLFKLRKFIKDGNFDIVHAHRDQALEISWLALLGKKSPKLIAQRGTVSRPPNFPLFVFRSKRSREVIAVSEAVKKVLVENGTSDKKISVIYGSVDLEEFSPKPPAFELKGKLGIPENCRILGSLSAYRKAKGFIYLMPALAVSMKKHKDVHAVFLGHGVPKNVGPLAEELGIADRCHFVGHQKNVSEWLSIMDLTMVAATGGEGLSGVLRESLAMEVPVISTDHAGNGEIVIDRETGLLVPQEDTDAFADAIDWALSNPDRMTEMAKRGHAWVEDNCSTDVHGKKILEVYKRVLDTNT